METNLKQIHLTSSWSTVDTLTYRGITVDFYEDKLGHQVITMWKDKVIEFGEFNTVYKDDMKLIIDDHLDTITRFPEFPEFYGAKLAYFNNSNYRDIKLTYKNRILRVYTNVSENDLFSITLDAQTTLQQYLLTLNI